MLANSLKPAVLSILRPLTGALIRSGIHPNALTFAGLAISCAAASVYAGGPLGWAATLLLLAGLFDVLDGAVAREGRRLSRYGAFLDSNLDRYAETAVFLGILWRFQGDPVTQILAGIALAGSLMVSYAKARAEGLGAEVRGGLLQRPERVVVLALGTYFGEGGLRIALWVLAILTNFTSVQRMLLVAGTMRSAPGAREGNDSGAGTVTVDPGEIEPAPRG